MHWHQLVENLHTHKRGTERAVHKPLLVLMLLARAQRGESRQVAYNEIEGPLRKALQYFGPPRRNPPHPEYPFWYLRFDGFWELEGDGLPADNSGTPSPKKFKENNVTGSVPQELWDELSGHRHQIKTLAETVLEQFWPDTMHDDIAAFVGLDLSSGAGGARARRDPAFREAVLRAYERRCAVCGYDGRLGDSLVGLEAAHIHFKQDHGRDAVDNGLALCALHHKIFDYGGIGLSEERRILVSQDFAGHEATRQFVLQFQGRPLQGPQADSMAPALDVVRWHQKNVFRGAARG
jgi:putative restriction endonuclease